MTEQDTSQWGEAAIIKDFFGEYQGRFLDLGAYDGVDGSNTRGLYLRGWNGVCVEANPLIFQRLLFIYDGAPGIECVNGALAPNSGLIGFKNAEQCGKCDKDGEFYVSAFTCHDLVQKFGDSFDFVSLDIEGMEMNIIHQLPILLKNTKLICFEDDIPCTRNRDYTNELLRIFAGYGFSRIIGTTSTPERSANTLIARQ